MIGARPRRAARFSVRLSASEPVTARRPGVSASAIARNSHASRPGSAGRQTRGGTCPTRRGRC